MEQLFDKQYSVWTERLLHSIAMEIKAENRFQDQISLVLNKICLTKKVVALSVVYTVKFIWKVTLITHNLDHTRMKTAAKIFLAKVYLVKILSNFSMAYNLLQVNAKFLATNFLCYRFYEKKITENGHINEALLLNRCTIMQVQQTHYVLFLSVKQKSLLLSQLIRKWKPTMSPKVFKIGPFIILAPSLLKGSLSDCLPPRCF